MLYISTFLFKFVTPAGTRFKDPFACKGVLVRVNTFAIKGFKTHTLVLKLIKLHFCRANVVQFCIFAR